MIPFVPSDVEFMAEECKRVAGSTGLNLMLPSMTLHPEGENAYDKAHYFIDAYGRLSGLLQGSDIKLGVLVQTMIGHGWSNASPCGNGFQVTINHTGGTRGRMCPLDEGFLQYADFVLSSLARFKPELFLMDDDTRLIDNSLLECFCPLHLAKFSKPYTREELTERVLAAKPGDPILEEFEAVRRDSLTAFCRRIRQAIDRVDASIPCGLSGAGREHLMFEKMALTLAGEKTEPFIRLGNAMYFESSAKEFPRRLWLSQLQKKACGRVKVLLDEADTFPQNLYSKSAVSMHAHITGGILNGLTGAKLWIANFINPKGNRNTAYEESMLRYQGFYRTLENEVRNITWKGPSTPLADLEKCFHPLVYPSYFTCPEWQSDALGKMGIPGTFQNPADASAECFMLTGELAAHMSDSDLEAMTRKNLFLDSLAAEEFQRRGYGKFLGVKITPDCPHFSYEQSSADLEKLRLLYNQNCRRLTPSSESTRIMSRLWKIPYASAPEKTEAGVGSTWFVNQYHAHVFVWCGTIDVYITSPERKRWLEHILNQLSDIPLTAANEQDLYVRVGCNAEGETVAAVFNLNFDPLQEIKLHCKTPPESVCMLMPDGTWKKTVFSVSREAVTVSEPLEIYRPLILKLTGECRPVRPS